MAASSTKAYGTAIYAYTPPESSTNGNSNKDAQAVQASLTQLVQDIKLAIAQRRDGHAGAVQPPSTSRWFLQIRTLRLAVPQTEGSSTSNSTRTMYMARYAAHPDTVTLIIEDPARAAVNVSTVGSGTFDHFLSSNLLPSQQHSRQEGSASYQPGRWIPRPSYCQVEGAVIEDAEADFRISVGMISTRGGASGTSSSASETLLIQLEYLASPFLPQGSGHILEGYLSHVLPKYSSIRNLSASTTTTDWKSLLGLYPPEEQKLPEWSHRNTSWCIVRLCKETRMV